MRREFSYLSLGAVSVGGARNALRLNELKRQYPDSWSLVDEKGKVWFFTAPEPEDIPDFKIWLESIFSTENKCAVVIEVADGRLCISLKPI